MIGRRLLPLLFVLLAPSAFAGERANLHLGWCSLKAADLASTELALSRGGYEANPLLRERAVRYGVGAGTCMLVAEADWKLRKHKKSRWAVRIIGIGLWGYATAHNLRAK